MTREEQIQYCRRCLNRKFDPEVGVICSLTLAKANFDNYCTDFYVDTKETEIIQQTKIRNEQSEQIAGPNSLESWAKRHGVAGGVVMLVVAALWFLLSFFAGHIMLESIFPAIVGIGIIFNEID